MSAETTHPPTSVADTVKAANLGAGPGAAAGSGYDVTAEALQHTYNLLKAKAQDLSNALLAHRGVKLKPCGSDPISQWATPALQAKVDAIAEHMTTFTADLDAAAEELKQALASYGATEDQVQASFQQFMTARSNQSAAQPGPYPAGPPSAGPSASAPLPGTMPNGRIPFSPR
jgi:hypothetical protein